MALPEVFSTRMAGFQYCSQETPGVHTHALKEPVLRTDRGHCPVLISTWKQLNWCPQNTSSQQDGARKKKQEEKSMFPGL